MDVQQLRRLKPELDGFLDRYAPLFGRDETQAHAKLFVHGLLKGGDRRNVENIAEAQPGGVVRSLQKFIAQARWRDDEILEEFQRHVAAELGDPDGTLNVDETGFPKKGIKSVGVKRQYAGCMGRVDSCQVGVFLNLSTPKGHVLIDRRLYLPEEWANDAPRREEAGVPKEVIFRTKPELALEMIERAAERGLPFRWVGGDCVYGDNAKFVRGVRELGKYYVVDVSSDTRVWVEEPTIIPAGSQGPRGRPTGKAKAAIDPELLTTVAARLPAAAWRRLTVAEGSQGPRVWEYAEVWVWFSEDGLPTGRERLVVRRSTGQEVELKYQRSNAPADVRLEKVASVGGQRWTIEQDFQAGKGECGLDEYETRGWVGWHHHTALAMLALWFLTLQKQRLGEKRAADDRARGQSRAGASTGRAKVG
jgi:SRSO17 transposase